MSSTPPVDGSFSEASRASELIWSGAAFLRRVQSLNERFLELLAQLARRTGEPVDLEIISQHRSLWRELGGSGRRHAARTPFLLIDVHFHDPAWWRAVKNSRVDRRRVVGHRNAFSERIASELMRETITLAWSTVAFNRNAASLLLGMTPSVATIISELDSQQVDRISARYGQCLRPRWEDFPAFWAKLLVAARDADQEALQLVRLHGAQLIGSELLPPVNGKHR